MFREAPGCRVAGNGLLMSFQCRLGWRNATLETWSRQSPTLQIERVRSAEVQGGTQPKNAEPVTASFPVPESPQTFTVFGPAGSSLKTVIVEVFEPEVVG